jgi:LAO/AO transport system kinase
MWEAILQQVRTGDIKAIARTISFIENDYPGYENLLQLLPAGTSKKLIGITGPPGAGKSTLTDALIGELLRYNKKIAVLCVDPSSPFNRGAVLGDRIRMSEWYTHPDVFIRSLATRGSMGGLHPKMIEITDLLKVTPYDYIIVETVGVGQSEIEIAGLADITVVVLVPEAGDEIQTMKAGLMEIADIFVVNKSDRPDADLFVKNLRMMLAPAFAHHYHDIPVVKTIASQKQGTKELFNSILHEMQKKHLSDKRPWLLAEKAWQLIADKKMKNINKTELKEKLETAIRQGHFNLYSFIQQF